MSLPYEILIRSKDGNLRGAVAYDTPLSDPRPLSVEELSLFGPEINAAALAQIGELEASHAAEIKTLQDQLAAASSPSVSSPILAELDAMFEALPEEIQTAFEVPYQTVRGLYLAGKTVRAYRFVEALTVPAEAEGTKAVILAKMGE